jgi:hypothetical protein
VIRLRSLSCGVLPSEPYQQVSADYHNPAPDHASQKGPGEYGPTPGRVPLSGGYLSPLTQSCLEAALVQDFYGQRAHDATDGERAAPEQQNPEQHSTDRHGCLRSESEERRPAQIHGFIFDFSSGGSRASSSLRTSLGW